MPAESLSPVFAALAIGAMAYIGLLHLVFWRGGRGESGHLWVGLFALHAVLYQVANSIRLFTTVELRLDTIARCESALGALMVFYIIAFGRTLNENRRMPDRMLAGSFAYAAFVVAMSLGTPLVYSSSPFLLVHLPYIWFGVGYCCFEAIRSTSVAPDERRVVVTCFGLGALIGTYAAISGTVEAASQWPRPSPPFFSTVGTLIFSIGFDHLLIRRHRRLHSQLEAVVGTATEELGDSEARYRALVDNSPLGVVACNRDGNVIAANPTILEILGVTGSSATRDLNLFTHPAVIGLGIETALRTCLESGEPYSRDVTWTPKPGKRLDLRLKLAAVRNPQGMITGAQLMTEDIEDQRRFAEQLRQSQKMEAVGRLAAGIAHEINNPMAYVRANLSMLQKEWSEVVRGDASEEDQSSIRTHLRDCGELIDEAIEGVERTIAIVKDVKEFSHTQTDGRVDANINEILEDALRIATPRLASAVRIERMYGELPSLQCAPGQLQQVFLNLIVNAIQAVGDSGTVWVITRARKGEILVRVEDDGCGMSPDTLEHLFDPFFTTKDAGEGTGLGLYISYEIVRSHEGDIQVMSTPGEGSAFEVSLAIEEGTADLGGEATQ